MNTDVLDEPQALTEQPGPAAACSVTTDPVELGHVEIFTDGSCLGNPGPGGWGVILTQPGRRKELSGGVAGTTNNRMEMTAVIEAFGALKRPCRATLHTDSQYLVQGALTSLARWKSNGWKLSSGAAVKNQDLWEAIDAAASDHEVTWVWLRGHAGHPENERADQLARKGRDLAIAAAASQKD